MITPELRKNLTKQGKFTLIQAYSFVHLCSVRFKVLMLFKKLLYVLWTWLSLFDNQFVFVENMVGV